MPKPAPKLDLKRKHRDLFSAKHNAFALIDVPTLQYLKVDGMGEPNTAPAYLTAVQSLYSTAYAIKFAAKAKSRDFVVPPLQGLWWSDDPSAFVERRKDEWRWTMMIMMPDFVTGDDFAQGKEKAEAKRGALADSLRLEALSEGSALQALHIGPYDDEGPLLAELHDTIMPEGGYDFAGHHHEIYLSDPRKTAPEKLKTILRQPVKKRS